MMGTSTEDIMTRKLTQTQTQTLAEIRAAFPDGATTNAIVPFPQPTVRALFKAGALVLVGEARPFGHFGAPRFTYA